MTPDEQEDYAERIAIILDGNPGMTEAEAAPIALRCLDRARAGYPVAQAPLPLVEETA